MNVTLEKSNCDEGVQELWQEYFVERTDTLRNSLVVKYMDVANRIAAFYYKKRIGGQTEFSDYKNLAVIGLIQAIEKFDPTSAAKFETFASYRIKGNILNSIKHFSEKNALIRHEQMRAAEYLDWLSESMESKQEIDLFERIVDATLNLAYATLLDSSIQFDVDQLLSSSQLDGYHHCEIQDLKRVIKEIVTALPKKQQVIVRYYYFYDLSFVEISELIGISKSRVSQLHSKAIENVREIYNKVVNIGYI
jgi:RNA polymerase sigma factor for flagellar operon FliA